MALKLKAGQKILVAIYKIPGTEYEQATVARRMNYMGPIREGYHPVRFADGGILMIHEEHLSTMKGDA